MIQYEEDGHKATQKYSIFVLQAKAAKNMKFFDWPKHDEKKSYLKKNSDSGWFCHNPTQLKCITDN